MFLTLSGKWHMMKEAAGNPKEERKERRYLL